MAIAFVGGVEGTASGTASIDLVRTLTAGNCGVIHSALYEAPGDGIPNSVSGGSNTWTQRAQGGLRSEFSGSTRASLWVAENLAGGSTTTTVAFEAGSYAHAALAEFSGVATSGAFDVAAQDAQGSSASANTGSTGTTSQADAVVIGSVASPSNDTTTNLAVGGGYTNIAVEQDGASFCAGSIDYLIVNSISSYSVGWTLDTNAWSCCAIVLSAAGSGGASFVPPRQTNPRTNTLLRM